MTLQSEFSISIVPTGVKIVEYLGNQHEIIIPSHIHGKPVVEIADFAFAFHCLTRVVLPNTLRTIGRCAFRSNFLTSLQLPPHLENIWDGAFMNNLLVNITLPDDVLLGVGAFANNRLENVQGSPRYVGENAFDGNPYKLEP